MVKLLRLNTEEELTNFYLKNCMNDDFLRLLFHICAERCIQFADDKVDFVFGQFIEALCIFSSYLSFKYNLSVVSIDLVKYFFKVNDLDIRDYIDID